MAHGASRRVQRAQLRRGYSRSVRHLAAHCLEQGPERGLHDRIGGSDRGGDLVAAQRERRERFFHAPRRRAALRGRGDGERALRLAALMKPPGEPEREHVELGRERGIAGRIAEGAHQRGDRRERRLLDDLAQRGDVTGRERLLALMGPSLPACSLAHGAS